MVDLTKKTIEMAKVNKDLVQPPIISWSAEAINQMTLMLEHDFTLDKPQIRIQVSKKGCHGFDYSIHFSNKLDEDFIIATPWKKLTVVVDAFTAYYLKQATIDYQFDAEENTDGFIVTHQNEDKFKGKFWKNDESKKPPMLENDLA